MRFRIVLSVVLAAIAGAVAGAVAASPAAAESWGHRDPAKDMYQQEVGPAPSQRQGDIRRVHLAYTRHKVVVGVAVRELHREHYSYLGLGLQVPRRGHRPTELGTDYYFSVDDGSDLTISGHDGLPVDCHPVTASHNYRKGRLHIEVPRDCLGRKATKVRAAVLFHAAYRDLHGGYVFTDDGLRKGAGKTRWSPYLARG